MLLTKMMFMKFFSVECCSSAILLELKLYRELSWVVCWLLRLLCMATKKTEVAAFFVNLMTL